MTLGHCCNCGPTAVLLLSELLLLVLLGRRDSAYLMLMLPPACLFYENRTEGATASFLRNYIYQAVVMAACIVVPAPFLSRRIKLEGRGGK